MNTLNVGDLTQVSGGLIGGGYTRSGVPLADASATHGPGQNSYGETVPGGEAHYYDVLGTANNQVAATEAMTAQLIACSGDNLLACAIATINALNAIEAITVYPPPYVKGPQGK